VYIYTVQYCTGRPRRARCFLTSFANSLGTRVHDSRSPLSVPPLASIAFLSVGTWSSLQSAFTVQLQVHPRVYRVCQREQQPSQQHLSTAISSGIAASPFLDLSSSISRHAKCSTADHVCMYSSTNSSVHHIVKNVHDARSTQWRHRLLSLCLCHATVSYRPGRAAWVLMTKRQAQRCHPRARSDSHAPHLLLSSAHPCGPGPCAHQPGHLPGCLCAARRGNDCQIRCAAAA
jgi:hypothetical protein